ncbi:MAG: O-antigen ligase family protein [Solirubrobacteraceae bacterium]
MIRRAAAAALISLAAAGMLWGLAAFGARALSPGRGASDRRVEAASCIALALTVAVLGGAGLVYADRIADRASAQWTAFVNLGNSGAVGNARLISGGGNRYDYWRIAWRAFADQPVAGLGAGNYDRVYFRERRTSAAVLQAHSVELQTLSELGLVGGIALAAFVGSVLVGLLVRARRARTSRRERQLSVAAGGIFLVWLVHTSVDWMHLIPGLTAIALAAAAVLVSPPRRGRPRRVSSLARPLLGAAAVLAICLASFSIARSALAERELSTARDELGRAPVSALRHANSALRYNDQSVPAWRLRAAALARFDLSRPARESLLIATEREPSDWVTWALLGDLAVRRGDVGAARAAYRRALALNPREPSLPGLVRDPPSALAGSGG